MLHTILFQRPSYIFHCLYDIFASFCSVDSVTPIIVLDEQRVTSADTVTTSDAFDSLSVPLMKPTATSIGCAPNVTVQCTRYLVADNAILLQFSEAVRTSAIQLKARKKFLYCSFVVVVLHLCGPLKGLSEPLVSLKERSDHHLIRRNTQCIRCALKTQRLTCHSS